MTAAAIVAFSVSGAQGAAGCGRCHRRLPVGGAANGMPRKAHDAPRSTPCTSPLAVVAKHDPACALHRAYWSTGRGTQEYENCRH